MLPVLLLVIGSLITGYALWQLRRWLRGANARLAEGPRRLEALAEELINSAEAASATVAEETERLADLIAAAESRAAELREVLERSAAPAPAPAGVQRLSGAHGERVVVTAVPVRFRHARKEIRRTVSEQAALSQPGPLRFQPAAALTGLNSVQAGKRPDPGTPPPPHEAEAETPARSANGHNDLPETHRLVHTLADNGQNVTQIARQLSMSKGEVQLILDLRRLN